MAWKHFQLREFTKAKVGKKVFTVKLSPVGFYLLDTLVTNILDPLRSFYDRPVRVTSGCRDYGVYSAMLKDREKHPEKAPPSRTSDHFYCNHANPFGVGASDITFHGIDPLQVLAWVMSEELPVGQVIAYPTKGFVHLSNPKTVLFVPEAIQDLPLKPKFLVWTQDQGYRSVG